MKHRIFAVLLVAFCSTTVARAQVALPTATRTLQLSAFGAVSGVYTGLGGGKNFGIVAGVDLGFSVWHGARPSIEVRGLYPVDNGSVVGQRSILFGPRVSFFPARRFHPYGDFLFGRGQMNYENGGYPFDNSGNLYLETTTNVYSPGFGLDYDLTPHFSVKIDGQAQRWGVPTPSGNIWANVGTAGIVYRFTFGPRSVP